MRTSLALASSLRQSCEVSHIREGREKPGLMPQHLSALKAAAELCGGEVKGDFLGSRTIQFFPGASTEKSLTIKLETAASIPLIMQALILPSLVSSSPVSISVRGGATDTFFAPSWDFFQHVFLKILERMGAEIEVETKKRGYFPEGGAEIILKIHPSSLKIRSLTKRGELTKISVFSGASSSLRERKVAERQITGARSVLDKLKGFPVHTDIRYYQTESPGSHICLAAEFTGTVLGTDVLGTLGKRAEDVGREAASNLLEEEKNGACLDKHLTDQALPFLALHPKKIEVKTSQITSHARTNMWVIEKFIKGKFETRENNITWLPLQSNQ